MCTGSEPSLIGNAGAGLSALGAIGNSMGTKRAYAGQAQVQRNNAQVAGWQAEDAIARGRVSASLSRSKTAQLKGRQRAAMAANGVDLGEGSALSVLTDTDFFGEIDANTITDNAAREAWAIRQQAAGYNAEAELMQYRSDRESPLAAGATSLLTSATRTAGNWYTPTSARKS